MRADPAAERGLDLLWTRAFATLLPDSKADCPLDVLGRMLSRRERVDEPLIRELWIELAHNGASGVLARLEAPASDGRPYDGPPRPETIPTLGLALRYIDGSLSDSQLTVGRIAEATGISRRWLSHLFATHMKVSVMGMVHALRVLRAAHMICNSGLSGKEIAAAVGYRRTSDLDAHFRKRMGLTPSAYRRLPSTRQVALLIGLAAPITINRPPGDIAGAANDERASEPVGGIEWAWTLDSLEQRRRSDADTNELDLAEE